MKNSSKDLVRAILEEAGIKINGKNSWDIQVHDERFYSRVFKDGALGLGESYMDEWWDVEKLDEFLTKLLLYQSEKKIKSSLKIKLFYLKTKLFNLQKRSRAHHVAEKHYNIGNEFYKDMLDTRMNYTCGYWKNAKNLEEAQEQKLKLVCEKLELEPGMKVLELGCGWGAFAKYAAENYGVEVTAVNISKPQVEYAREITKGLPVEVKLMDWREVSGRYDRVLSIGIMEHVGYKNYRHYMEKVSEVLKDDGISLIHTIGGNISTTSANPWTTKYIFPNGMLPSIAQLGKAMERLFIMEDWHNFGPDYDKTLMAWFENFEKNWHKYEEKFGRRFYRMWKYYLLSSAAGFRSRQTQLWQIVMTKMGRKQPKRVCL